MNTGRNHHLADGGAADWVLRHDRGLSAEEQDEFSEWLAADPRHRAAWAEYRWGWEEFDRLAGLQISVHAVPDPDLLKPAKIRWQIPVSAGVAIAASLVAGLLLWPQPTPPHAESAARSAACTAIEERELDDGSTVKLNRGASVTEHYSSAERHVRLERGEAHFTVMPDASRPFVVAAGGVEVFAVGTAFNVRLDVEGVEVLVTEGEVRVHPEGRPSASGRQAAAGTARMEENRPAEGVRVGSGERMLVQRGAQTGASEVQQLSPQDMESRLAWQPRLLDFTNAPLAEIVAEFNRHNPVRLTLGDPGLASVRLSATFRSDNVEGFVRLMISDFGMRADGRGESEIVLTISRPAR